MAVTRYDLLDVHTIRIIFQSDLVSQIQFSHRLGMLEAEADRCPPALGKNNAGVMTEVSKYLKKVISMHKIGSRLLENDRHRSLLLHASQHGKFWASCQQCQAEERTS